MIKHQILYEAHDTALNGHFRHATTYRLVTQSC